MSDGKFRLMFLHADGTDLGYPRGNYGTNTRWDRVVSEKTDWKTSQWYYVVGVWDGTTGTNSLKLYINGELDAQWTADAAMTLTKDTQRFWIGSEYWSSGFEKSFNGSIDEVHIYNRALSAEEIRQHYYQYYQEKIIFASDRSGNWDIWMMNPDGTGLQQLTTDPADDFQPDLSPDGTKIVFISTRTGRTQPWVMNVDGSNQIQLLDVDSLSISYPYGRNLHFPRWAPDGSYIIFEIHFAGIISGPWAAIFRCDPDGSNPQVFVDFGPSIKGGYDISDDGTKFAYCREDSNYWAPTLKVSIGDIEGGAVNASSIYNLGITMDGLADRDVVWFLTIPQIGQE